VSEPFLGEIRLVPYTFAPRGWAFCEGQLLPINQNQALFSLLGTNFGGDGRVNFGVPDLRGRVPVGAGDAPGGSSYPLGATGGVETVKLAPNQMPIHTHSVKASTSVTGKAPTNTYPAAGSSYSSTQNTTMNKGMLSRNGGNQPHENRQPYVSLSYIIALQGIFPSRS
jgi:microcystin-dependent protein